MIKTYRYNADRNTVSHILQGKGGNTVRYNFERGNIITKRKPEAILKDKYSQELLESSELFKKGVVTLIRTERTPEDDIEEQKQQEPTPVANAGQKVIDSVRSNSDLISFINAEDNRTDDNAFRTPSGALKWASKHGYVFPNYNPD